MSHLPFHPNQDGTVSVMFRKAGNGEASQVAAIFPCEPSEASGRYFLGYFDGSFQNYNYPFLHRSHPARSWEYVSLVGTLERRLGVRLRVIQKITAEMREVFNKRCTDMEAASAA